MFNEINTRTCRCVCMTNWVKRLIKKKTTFISIFHKYKHKHGMDLIYITKSC